MGEWGKIPTLNTLEDISNIYGIDIHELLGKNIVVMKTKLNWFAILGLVVFNGILLGTSGTLIALVMFFLYFIGSMSIVSTIVVIYNELFQSTVVDQSIYHPWLLVLVPVIGALVLYIATRLTKMVWRYVYRYIRYNVSKAYYRVQ